MDDGDRKQRSPEANHVQTGEVGGSSKEPGRARYVRALRVLPDDWEPKAGVPRTRGDCPTERPCPYVRCEWNLWMTDARDRPGRRWEGGRSRSVVIAHTTQNCGADIAEHVRRERLSISELADAIGLSDRQVRRIVKRALGKLSSLPDAEEALRQTVDR